MILDLEKFIAEEMPGWQELERLVKKYSEDGPPSLSDARRLHYLYERASSDLAKLATFSGEPETRRYLETIVARAYSEIHATRESGRRFRPFHWFLVTFPQTFRRHLRAFNLTLIITLAGTLFGWFAVHLDPEAKGVLLPFGHGQRDPAQRVRLEERGVDRDHLEGRKSRFSAQLMTHNTKVSVTAMALGAGWGIGTVLLLFYNGVILGGICFDYVAAGQSRFLAAWLLPHGSIEIPAILLAGQAGLVLAGAVIGWGRPVNLRARLREVAPDLVTLIGGVAVMLIWAGLVEAFFSQYHEPVLPYGLKIAFGTVELLLLIAFLSRAGFKESSADVLVKT